VAALFWNMWKVKHYLPLPSLNRGPIAKLFFSHWEGGKRSWL
jgi:hypothetical protein